MGSPRIRANRLSMRVGDPPVDYWADATRVVMDKDVEYVPDLGGGYDMLPPKWYFDVEAVQSTAEGSLWTFLFEHSGETVPFAYAPHGNENATTDKPHFTGLVWLPAPPSVGGEADQYNEYTFETRLFIIQGPLRVTS